MPTTKGLRPCRACSWTWRWISSWRSSLNFFGSKLCSSLTRFSCSSHAALSLAYHSLSYSPDGKVRADLELASADRVLQKCSSDHNQNQRPEGHQDQMKPRLKCGLVEEVSLYGAHARQAKLNHGAERASGGSEGMVDLRGHFIQVGEKEKQAEAEEERAGDRMKAFGGCLPLCHVNLSWAGSLAPKRE